MLFNIDLTLQASLIKVCGIRVILLTCSISPYTDGVGLLLAGALPIAPTGWTLTPNDFYTNPTKAMGNVRKGLYNCFLLSKQNFIPISLRFFFGL